MLLLEMETWKLHPETEDGGNEQCCLASWESHGGNSRLALNKDLYLRR